ncbi:family 16 glycosylhydrolase [Mangrovibacterium marinum]|uniref:Glycosyl hydrolase family 16 n=1 Tax=Mangrovibacterium marinum TaxID=1639118 RepID=A0A2T5C2N4_9BACT|nr:family 16 glycosylhydrolase [Mangrovibacterium marinum]PTN09010.1 glycosyl hydrolase family 16 [Mangrovibacterium marinum]
MKKYNIYLSILIFGMPLLLGACQTDNYELGKLITPTNVDFTYEIVGADAENPYGDGTGLVSFTATADHEITYTYSFGDGTDRKVAPDGKISHQFSKTGVNTYLVTVDAVGAGGLASSKTMPVEVLSTFTDDEALELLTGGSSKKWYWAADQPGNIGLGPNDRKYSGNEHTWSYWFTSTAWHPDKLCMYDAEFVFTKTADGLTFEQTAGTAYIPADYANTIGVEGNTCHGEDVVPSLYGVKNVSFSPSSSIATVDGGYRGTTMTFSDGGFMCWYVGTSVHEIIQLTDDILKVRIEGTGANAWYCTFTTTNPNEGNVEYNDLVWSDEFETDGAPNSANWTYDLGAGGWGNNEAQSYTNNPENVSISDGILKITAKADGAGGYTSARIKTEGLYEFTYGRVEVRAKLPAGGGTWPAIWMLGANFSTAGWPDCGEIDIMEAIGNDPGYVQSALHTPSSSGDTDYKGSTVVADASEAFHIYSVNWSPNEISFLIDGEIYYTYVPQTKDAAHWPFDADQFLILNVAMGGTLGGTIDPSFTQATMEIDYVRVYQNTD